MAMKQPPVELDDDEIEDHPATPMHPAGKITAYDEESGLPIVKRRAPGPDVPKQQPDTASIAQKEPETGRDVLQPTSDPSTNQTLATAQHGEIKQAIEQAIQGIKGAELVADRPVKDEDRTEEKIEDEGQPAETIPDYSGFRISVDSEDARTQVLDALRKAFTVVREKDEFQSGSPDTGFHAHMLQVKGPTGATSEIQVLPKEVADAGEGGHPLYSKAREGDQSAAAELKAKNEKDYSGFVKRTSSPQSNPNPNSEKIGGRGESPEKSEHPGAGEKSSASRFSRGKIKAEVSDGKASETAEDSTGNMGVSQLHAGMGKSDQRRKDEDNDSASGDRSSAGTTSGALSVGSRVVLPSGQAATVAYVPAKGSQLPSYRFKTDDGKTISLRASQVEGKVKPEADDTPSGDGWIGVDLDGTTAKYSGFKGPTSIGAPIPRMVDRIKRWLAKGEDVRFFTARIDNDKDGKTKAAIDAWSKKHIGQVLPVTNRKDMHLKALFDDRAVQVSRNEGAIMGSHKQAAAKS